MAQVKNLLKERIGSEKIKVDQAAEQLESAINDLEEAKIKVRFFRSNLKQRKNNLRILIKRRK